MEGQKKPSVKPQMDLLQAVTEHLQGHPSKLLPSLNLRNIKLGGCETPPNIGALCSRSGISKKPPAAWGNVYFQHTPSQGTRGCGVSASVPSPPGLQKLTSGPHLLFETLVVTAVTEAKEMVSGSSAHPCLMAFRSRSSASKTAGSSAQRRQKNVSYCFHSVNN